MNKPVVHLYSACWNEEKMLPFFFRHYDKITDKYIFFDDNSDDRTIEMINRHPRAEVRPLPETSKDSFVMSALELHNNCWKESRGSADWVIITAVDEFLYHPDITNYLIKCKSEGITAIPALGYQMLSEEFPGADSDLINEVPDGAAWQDMNKLSLFDPDRITEINYSPGRHESAPEGEVKYSRRDELLLLHFKYISFDFMFERHKQLLNKLRGGDIKNKWGLQYTYNEEKQWKEWNKFKRRLTRDVVRNWSRDNRFWSSKNKRWWRPNKYTFPFFR